MSLPDGSLLFLSDVHGIYIPQHFAQSVDFANVENVSEHDWAEIAAGPACKWYWEAWTAICDRAVVVNPKTRKRFTIHQDSDCWLIPEGAVWECES